MAGHETKVCPECGRRYVAGVTHTCPERLAHITEKELDALTDEIVELKKENARLKERRN